MVVITWSRNWENWNKISFLWTGQDHYTQGFTQALVACTTSTQGLTSQYHSITKGHSKLLFLTEERYRIAGSYLRKDQFSSSDPLKINHCLVGFNTNLPEISQHNNWPHLKNCPGSIDWCGNPTPIMGHFWKQPTFSKRIVRREVIFLLPASSSLSLAAEFICCCYWLIYQEKKQF